jgi:hypothetical protein
MSFFKNCYFGYFTVILTKIAKYIFQVSSVFMTNKKYVWKTHHSVLMTFLESLWSQILKVSFTGINLNSEFWTVGSSQIIELKFDIIFYLKWQKLIFVLLKENFAFNVQFFFVDTKIVSVTMWLENTNILSILIFHFKVYFLFTFKVLSHVF